MCDECKWSRSDSDLLPYHTNEYRRVRREHVHGHGNSTLRAGRSSRPGEPHHVYFQVRLSLPVVGGARNE